jgi:hypothetical protein
MPSPKVLGARGSCRPTEADVGSQAEAEITLSAPRGSVAVSLAHQVCTSIFKASLGHGTSASVERNIPRFVTLNV